MVIKKCIINDLLITRPGTLKIAIVEVPTPDNRGPLYDQLAQIHMFQHSVILKRRPKTSPRGKIEYTAEEKVFLKGNPICLSVVFLRYIYTLL